jgi:hypothetical protein
MSSFQKTVNFLIKLYVICDFIFRDHGKEYGVTLSDRKRLFSRIYKNFRHIPSATSLIYHIVISREILNIPKKIKGDIIECGTYKGSTATTLSIVAAMTNRKLWICDSFSGLPSDDQGLLRNYPHLMVSGRYKKNMYSGSQIEVMNNIIKYGEFKSCDFVKGFFAKTLKKINARYSFVFVDVDLLSSMKDCIKYTWPKLSNGGLFYTDDSCDISVIKIWFDDLWWKKNLHHTAPGYVGSGCGLPLSLSYSSLGYIRKITNLKREYKKADFLV